jgi:NAD+-dependent protein deacetylase sirtuin 4
MRSAAADDDAHVVASLAESLAGFLRGRRVVALTGAGISTESGIPDYRGPTSRPRAPIQYREFVGSALARARYWARAAVGWAHLADARPNPAHRAMAALESSGAVDGVITQNVDGLHHAAGSRAVIELHGAIDRVKCLECAAVVPRADVQVRLLALNPALSSARAAAAPDGDAELAIDPASIEVPACRSCGGVLKPDVVFFGENVPRATVDAAWAMFDRGEALLVAGSSLTVFSGYRFVRRAAERGVPVAIVNIGPTRGDAHAALKVEARLGDLLPRVVAALTPAPA